MIRSRLRVVGLTLLIALLVAVSGCGAGGFGNADPVAPDTSVHSYVALGDGFAAAPYAGATADAGCVRSRDNYPAQVAKALKITTFTDVTCTGVGSKALTERSTAPSTRRPERAQFDAVTAKTELITVGIGIEDGTLLSDAFRICMALPCGPGVVPAKAVLDQLAELDSTLTADIRTLQDRAPKAYIVVVGYPQIVPATGRCAKLPRMTDAQLSGAYQVLGALNDHLRSAARQTGSAFVDVAAISGDHTACSAEPWVNGVVGKKAKAFSFHPLAAEQRAVAAAIADQVRLR